MGKTIDHAVSRRNFVKGSFVGAAAAAGALGSASLFGCAPTSGGSSSAASSEAASSAASSEAASSAAASSAAALPEDEIHWSQCNVNCGGNCIFQWHSKDGKVAYMETDNIGDADLQGRACLRGRSMRRWLNSPDRLLHPMKRTGERGSGEFE